MDKESEKLIQDMREWEKTFKHRKPCERYKETGYCRHLAEARGRKFKDSIWDDIRRIWQKEIESKK